MAQDSNGQGSGREARLTRSRGIAAALVATALVAVTGLASPARAGDAASSGATRERAAAQRAPRAVRASKSRAGKLSPGVRAGITQRLQALRADHDGRAKRQRAPRIYIVPQPPPGALVPPGPDAPQAEKDRYQKLIEGLR